MREHLLTQHAVIRATGPQQLAEGFHELFGISEVRTRPSDAPFDAMVNRVPLKGVTLNYCAYSTSARIAFKETAGFKLLLCCSGNGTVLSSGKEIQMTPNSSSILPDGVDFDSHYGDSYSHMALQFDGASLSRKMELLQGRSAGNGIVLRNIESVATSRISRLRSNVMNLAHHLSGDINPQSLVVSELSEALQTSFLVENAGLFPDFLAHNPASVTRNDVRRLEDYIHAHWDEVLTIEDVAIACGVSVRSVFLKFRQTHGIAPMAYLRAVRLEQANRLLRESHGTLSVIEVALRCGFASPGHFARRYEEKFGELPSTTVARHRG